MGTDIAAYLDEHGMPGAVNRVGFDNWYPGFLDFTHIFRNSISFFTETALLSLRDAAFLSLWTNSRKTSAGCVRKFSTAARGKAGGGGCATP